jgi:mRNA-decapping enzyme subunit 2
MLKGQGPLSPTSSEATARPSKKEGDLLSSSSDVAKQPAQMSRLNAESIAATVQGGDGPVQINPEHHLPFGALSILSRPKQSGFKSAHDHVLQKTVDKAHGSSFGKYETASTAEATVSSSQGLPPFPSTGEKAGTNPTTLRVPTLAQSASMTYNSPQYQGLPTSSANMSFLTTGVLQSRQEKNPGQRKQLLSLFGKSLPSAATIAGDEKGKAREQTELDQMRSGSPQSRVASMNSASGNCGASSSSDSRRGSQTPISPADREFLLGYLQSVSSNAR